MHLTNYAINKKSEDFVYNENLRNDDIGHKRSFSSIISYLEKKFSSKEVDKVMLKIRHIICKTMCSV